MVEQDNTAVGRPRGSIGRIGLGLALASLAAILTLSLFNPG
ncbi:MAG: hypothetical protein ABSF95_16315 [Verrucomicrobiota bacterium]|jgi:hypothetical protein